MEDLEQIERMLKVLGTQISSGEAWFDDHWKPKFERVRAAMVSPQLLKAMCDMMECEPWHEPFDELQKKASK